MSDYRPPRSFVVKTINAASRTWNRLTGGRGSRLDREFLLERAALSAGLSDFGDGSFWPAFDRLVPCLEEEADLSPLGRGIAQAELLRLLENRLLFTEDRKRFPEIAEQEVRAPIFILGMPRTGSTILQQLFARDPKNRVLLSWESQHPSPPPETATFETDPRIKRSGRFFRQIDLLIPGFKQMHPMAPQLPEECVALMSYEFMSFYFYSMFRVPSYQDWFEAQDCRPAYAGHRRLLEHLQARHSTEHGWVLKSPQHVWTLPALLEEYPDARIIHTHRDPVKTAASLGSLLTLLRGMSSDRVSPEEIGADVALRLERGLETTLEVRADPHVDQARFYDVHFRAFMQDPIDTVARVYDHFQMKLDREALDRMRAHLAANPSDKHGRHEYTLKGAGLDLETERARFSDYQAFFNIELEL